MEERKCFCGGTFVETEFDEYGSILMCDRCNFSPREFPIKKEDVIKHIKWKLDILKKERGELKGELKSEMEQTFKRQKYNLDREIQTLEHGLKKVVEKVL